MQDMRNLIEQREQSEVYMRVWIHELTYETDNDPRLNRRVAAFLYRLAKRKREYYQKVCGDQILGNKDKAKKIAIEWSNWACKLCTRFAKRFMRKDFKTEDQWKPSSLASYIEQMQTQKDLFRLAILCLSNRYELEKWLFEHIHKEPMPEFTRKLEEPCWNSDMYDYDGYPSDCYQLFMKYMYDKPVNLLSDKRNGRAFLMGCTIDAKKDCKSIAKWIQQRKNSGDWHEWAEKRNNHKTLDHAIIECVREDFEQPLRLCQYVFADRNEMRKLIDAKGGVYVPK